MELESFIRRQMYLRHINIFYFILLSQLFSINFTIPSNEKISNIESLNNFIDHKYFYNNIKKIDIFPDIDYNISFNEYVVPEKLTNSSLNPLNRELNILESVHLLRRTTFGPQIEEINFFQTLEISEAFDFLNREIELPQPPSDWVNHPFPEYLSDFNEEEYDSLINAYVDRFSQMQNWWMDQMYYTPSHLREQMTLFWHDHFATSGETVFFPPAMYHQNRVIRENSLGNIKTLITNMTFDPAMMIWLDNNQNSINSINENFARELLELFTLGEGNYTEDDIIGAARALTGYVTDGLNVYFLPNQYDDGLKTFLGQTGNFNAIDIIDIIFEQPQTAYFISEKLYKWFVYENTNDDIVQELANIMFENNYEIEPVLSVLFNSEHFFDETFFGAKYKDPVTHTVSCLRQLYLDINEPIDFPYSIHEIVQYVQILGGQQVFFPPDVSGWPGYRNWINTYTFPWRKLYTNYLIDGTLNYVPDPIEFADRIPNGLSDPDALLDYLYIYFFSIQPSQLTKQNLMDELLAGADPFEWHLVNYEGAIARFGLVVQRMMRLSEFQLK